MTKKLNELIKEAEKREGQKIERIVRLLMCLGWEMGKKQLKTPFKYTLDTDKGEKYWKEIMKIFTDSIRQIVKQSLGAVVEELAWNVEVKDGESVDTQENRKIKYLKTKEKLFNLIQAITARQEKVKEFLK